jgi:multicomponent Na+:H+ antiporter subunit D
MSFIKFGYYAFFHGSYDGSVPDANRGQSIAMVSVAVLCVFYGVSDGSLFALLPFDVTSDAAVGHVYETYTIPHLIEGFGLAVIGLIGFAVTKKPLSNLGRVPDIDSLYNPTVFYGARGLVVGVTELYAAVDRSVVQATAIITQTITAPNDVIARLRDDDSLVHPMRAGIGLSILILAVFVTVALLALS